MHTWRIRRGSPMTFSFFMCGRQTSMASLPAFACKCISPAASATSSGKLKGSSLIESFPFSIFDMSRTSLIRLKRCFPERLIFFRHSSTLSRSSMCAAAIAVIPMMAFMGVRISWLMLERNRLFALLAALALSRALLRASRCCSSSWRCSSMRREIRMASISSEYGLST